SLGLVYAAVLGLTDPNYNSSTALQFIPNMDGFPNGRRLEDDVTRIELQAVSGVVLAAVGLWYDDYTAGGPNPVTTDLLNVITYTTGVESNDVPFTTSFPYLASPHNGFDGCTGNSPPQLAPPQINSSNLGIATPEAMMIQNFPNPVNTNTTFRYRVQADAIVSLEIYDITGELVDSPVKNETVTSGTHEIGYNATDVPPGIYFAALKINSEIIQTIKCTVAK